MTNWMLKIFLIASLLSVGSTDNCVKSHYRTLDGSCNNLNHSLWGAAGTPYGRLVPAWYGDGISSPAKSITGEELPGSRLISTKLFDHKNVSSPNHTIVMMQFGQFVAHDMALGGAAINPSCCEKGKITSNKPHCFSILIPNDDPVRSLEGIECMSFQRTLTDRDNEANENKSDEPAQQISVVTSYLDLSLIYGNSEKELEPIRLFSGGKLKMDKVDGFDYPPYNPSGDEICYVENQGETCFLGGDPRLNQSPDLSILHIFFIREHNRLADILYKLNLNWSDEKIFQEARRVNIAQYQYIVYYEWLPEFLGEEQMMESKLIYHKKGAEYVNDYDPNINAAALNEHSASAFRYYHSLIEGNLDLLSESRDVSKSIKLSDTFMKPKILQQEDNYDSLSRGMATQNFQMADKNYDLEVKEFLLKHLEKYGDDIRAIDLQRGRDHGIGSYESLRQYCGFPPTTSWEDWLLGSGKITEKHLNQMKSLYADFNDVDLSVGGIFEKKIPGTLAGPVFHCIYVKQFYNTRVGDRYWFETGDPDLAFPPNQLSEIRKSSMARIFCDNGNNILNMQPNALKSVNEKNNVVACSDIPAVDYNLWQSAKQK